ncbi:MAG: hypothetical protein QXN26_03655 [Thermoplasmataceae archaeon]
MSNERLMYGSIGSGIISGVLLLILIGWIPLYGWIIAGLAAGLAARGSARGFISALISGVIVSMGIVLMALFMPFSDIAGISSFLGNAYLNAHAFPYLYSLLSNSTIPLVKIIAVDYIAIPVVGGLIGGAILNNGFYIVESTETTTYAPANIQAAEPQISTQEAGEEASKIS